MKFNRERRNNDELFETALPASNIDYACDVEWMRNNINAKSTTARAKAIGYEWCSAGPCIVKK